MKHADSGDRKRQQFRKTSSVLTLDLIHNNNNRMDEAVHMKILVVDDHTLIREALYGVMRELRDDTTIIEAPDSLRAMRCIEENPDLELIVLDLYLPDGSGFDLLAELRQRAPTIAVVVLSASNDRDDIVRALDLGALGFIPKSTQHEVMVSAFKLIFSGGIYLPQEIIGRSHSQPATQPKPARLPSAVELGLTERQREVLGLMMQGKSNKMIGRVLEIAEPTVKNHVTAVMKALKASNRTETVIAATALGLGTRKDAE